jgi:hypothetical protein
MGNTNGFTKLKMAGEGESLFHHLGGGGGRGGAGGRGSSQVLLFRFIDHEFLASDHKALQPEARQDATHTKI